MWFRMKIISLIDECIEEAQAPNEIIKYIRSFDETFLKHNKFYKVIKTDKIKDSWITGIKEELFSGLEQNILFLIHDHSYTYDIFKGLDLYVDRLVILDAHNDYTDSEGIKLYNYNFISFIEDRFNKGMCLGIRHQNSKMPKHPQIIYYRNYELADKENVTKNLIEHVKGKNVYLSIDMDVLDPVYFNEVDYPIPGGIDIKELLYFVYICRRYAKQLLIDLSEYKFKSFKSKEFKVYKKLIEDIAEIVET